MAIVNGRDTAMPSATANEMRTAAPRSPGTNTATIRNMTKNDKNILLLQNTYRISRNRSLGLLIVQTKNSDSESRFHVLLL